MAHSESVGEGKQAIRREIEELARRLEIPESVKAAELVAWLDPYRDIPEPPIERCLGDYLDHLAVDGKAKSYIKSTRSALRRAIKGCDVCEPTDLGPSVLEAWLQWRCAKDGPLPAWRGAVVMYNRFSDG